MARGGSVAVARAMGDKKKKKRVEEVFILLEY